MSRQSASEIEREAASWLARLDREGPSPALLRAIDDWQAGDTRRRGAFLQAEAAWVILDRLDGEVGEAGQGLTQVSPTPVSMPNRRRLIAGGLAALAAGIAATVYLGLPGERYRTTVGEIRRIPLADGSTAAVNSGSAISVAIGEHQRTLRLETGEVWVQVARDSARPFEVIAGTAHVRAIGTAFAVRRRETGVEVLVNEGTVEIWSAGADTRRKRVSAGGRAMIGDDAQVSLIPASASGVDRALAWRAGKIDLANETLAEAAAEFNRHNQRAIVIADPDLAGERFHGLFRTDDPEGFALAVRRSLNVPVEISASEIRIGDS